MKKLFENIGRIKSLMEIDTTEVDEYEIKKGNMDSDGMGDDSDVDKEIPESELSEEGDEAPASGGGSAGYPSVTKWESGRTLGPTYKGPNAKWESGIKRGKGNTLL